jgi:hypothetical protein
MGVVKRCPHSSLHSCSSASEASQFCRQGNGPREGESGTSAAQHNCAQRKESRSLRFACESLGACMAATWFVGDSRLRSRAVIVVLERERALTVIGPTLQK